MSGEQMINGRREGSAQLLDGKDEAKNVGSSSMMYLWCSRSEEVELAAEAAARRAL